MSVLFHAPKNDHKWSTVYEHHVYRGSLVRHVAVDNAIILVAKFTSLRLIRCVRLYRVLRLYCVLLWGWNCNFPLSSVALYAVDYCFRGGGEGVA